MCNKIQSRNTTSVCVLGGGACFCRKEFFKIKGRSLIPPMESFKQVLEATVANPGPVVHAEPKLLHAQGREGTSKTESCTPWTLRPIQLSLFVATVQIFVILEKSEDVLVGKCFYGKLILLQAILVHTIHNTDIQVESFKIII